MLKDCRWNCTKTSKYSSNAALFPLWASFIKTQMLSFCICVTVIVSPILQGVLCSRCYLVGTSGASNMCCTQEGVGSACCCDLRLYQWFITATALQPIIQVPRSGHLYVLAAKHHNKLVFSIHLWPLELLTLHLHDVRSCNMTSYCIE